MNWSRGLARARIYPIVVDEHGHGENAIHQSGPVTVLLGGGPVPAVRECPVRHGPLQRLLVLRASADPRRVPGDPILGQRRCRPQLLRLATFYFGPLHGVPPGQVTQHVGPSLADPVPRSLRLTHRHLQPGPLGSYSGQPSVVPYQRVLALRPPAGHHATAVVANSSNAPLPTMAVTLFRPRRLPKQHANTVVYCTFPANKPIKPRVAPRLFTFR